MEKQSQGNEVNVIGTNLIALFMDRYGYLAFGVLSFLVIWFAAFKPLVDTYRITFDHQQKIVEQMQSNVRQMQALSNDQQQIANTNNETSKILERTVNQLNK